MHGDYLHQWEMLQDQLVTKRARGGQRLVALDASVNVGLCRAVTAPCLGAESTRSGWIVVRGSHKIRAIGKGGIGRYGNRERLGVCHPPTMPSERRIHLVPRARYQVGHL